MMGEGNVAGVEHTPLLNFQLPCVLQLIQYSTQLSQNSRFQMTHKTALSTNSTAGGVVKWLERSL